MQMAIWAMSTAFALRIIVGAIILIAEVIGLTLALRDRRSIPIRRAPRGTMATVPRDGPLLTKANLFEAAALLVLVLTNNDRLPQTLALAGISLALVLSLCGLAVLARAVRKRMSANPTTAQESTIDPRSGDSF